jgi:hypothetical protein
MTRNVLASFRLMAGMMALAAGIAGFALRDAAPAGATPPVHTPVVLADAG